MAHIINNPHAIYYNGELIGIITNPDPYGNIQDIVKNLDPNEGLCEVRPMHPSTELDEAIRPLPETIEMNMANIDDCTQGIHLRYRDQNGICTNCGK